MLEWLEATSLAASVRQSTWFYPILEIIHITGLVLVTGTAMMFDLRLLGLSKRLPVDALAQHLLPWSRGGLFFLVIPSGFLLFISNAVELGNDFMFWLKMTLLLTAIVNAVRFHRFTFRSVSHWNENKPAPPSAKATAILSVLLWISIIACGRLLAY
jgi:hypothetical protein